MTILPILDIEKTAIIVVDKQDGYFSRQTVSKRKRALPDNAEVILENIDNFIEKCRDHKLKIYWTQMIEDVVESPENIAEIMNIDTDRVEVKKDSHDFQFAGRTSPISGEPVVLKYHYDAFAQTNLDELLKRDGIENVVFVGGYASRCVLGTAYGANGHDYRIIVIRDLVVNQVSDIDELASFYKVIESILGFTCTANDFFNRIQA